MKAIAQVFGFDIISKVILAVVSMLLIRFMPKSEYATYTFAISAVTLVTQLLSGSFNRIYIVGYQTLNLKEESSLFLLFQLTILSVISLLFWFAPGIPSQVYFLGVGLAFAISLSEFAKTTLQQEMRFLQFSLAEIARSSLFLVAVGIAIYMSGDHLSVSQVLLGQTFAMFSVFLAWYLGRISWGDLLRVRAATRKFKTVVFGRYKHLLVYFLMIAGFSQMDVFMLKILSDDSGLATYGSAFRYYAVLLLSLNAIHTVLLPAVQKMSSREEWHGVVRRINILLLVFLPIVILLAWGAEFLIPFIDNGKYPGAILVFRILAVSALFSLAFSPHVNLLMRFEDFRFLAILISIALGVGIIINVLLIPYYGPAGAAVTTFLTAGLVNFSIFMRSGRFVRMLGDQGTVG